MSLPIPFLDAIIKSFDDDQYIKASLDPNQNAIIYAQNAKIYIKESLSSFLNIWVLPNEICPNVVFELPNSTDYSIHLHSNVITDSICIFLPEIPQNSTQTVLYGVNSSTSDQLILFSNQKNSFLNPLKICQSLFCYSTVLTPSFFQLRHQTPNSTSIYFELITTQKTQLPLIPQPIPLYNYSGQFTFGDEFDIATFHETNHPLKKNRFILLMILIFESIFMFFVILLKIIIKFMIYKLNTKGNKKQENCDRRPLTVVLNQYCPNTSALLVSV